MFLAICGVFAAPASAQQSKSIPGAAGAMSQGAPATTSPSASQQTTEAETLKQIG
jgi:hypothetical protein